MALFPFYIKPLFEISCFIILAPLSAQNGYLRGEVSDAYLQEGLPGVEAALLRSDSSVVSTATSKYQIIENKDTHGNTSGVADRYSGAAFRLKAPAEG